MRSVIFLLACALVASLPRGTRGQAGCRINDGVAPAVVCSGSMSVEEIGAFLRSLEANGHTDFMDLGLYSNPTISRLPENFLGDLRFHRITISGLTNLVQVEDFLGASSHTLTLLYFVGGALSELPRLTAPNLYEMIIYQEEHLVIRRDGFAKMRGIGKLEFNHVSIEPFAFYDLKQLFRLEIHSLAPEPLVEGSFHFDSPQLMMVFVSSYNSSWNGEIEAGAFDGFQNTSILSLEAAAKISPDIFHNVLSRGATLSIGHPVTCDCQVAWIRLSTFLSNAWIDCSVGNSTLQLKDIDEAHFEHCCSGC